MGILAMHVDDVFRGNDLFQKNVIAELKKIFCFIYIPNSYKEIKVFGEKMMTWAKRRRRN